MDQQCTFWRLVRIYLPQGLPLQTQIEPLSLRIAVYNATATKPEIIRVYLW